MLQFEALGVKFTPVAGDFYFFSGIKLDPYTRPPKNHRNMVARCYFVTE